MDPQEIARVTGVFFLITIITSIPACFFYVPVLDDVRYIVGADTLGSPGPLYDIGQTTVEGRRAT